MLKNNLLEYKDLFDRFLIENGYDLNKVRVLAALIFLNIAPLHHTPYNRLLYYLGKYTLFKELNNSTYNKKIPAGELTDVNRY